MDEKTEPKHSTGARHMLDGTIRVFLSESLLIPTGLITTIFLTRILGPESYGIYGLAVGIVLWIEYSICNMFGGTSIKFIGETDDWEPIATTVLKLYLIVSAAAVIALWLFSGKIAAILNAPKLGSYLSLLAIDIPIFVLSTAHRHILVGLGKFKERALTSAARWLSRLVLIVILVGIGLSVEGAILGIIASSLLELIIVRSYIRPPIFKHSDFDTRKLWGFVAPLFLFSVSMRLYDKLDLLLLKGMGGTAEQAGIYVAAQNLSIVPGLFALSFSPLLLATISRTISSGNKASVAHLVETSYRIVVLFLPFAAMTAGCSNEVVKLILGVEYEGSAPLLSLLIFGSIATIFISVNYAVLTASGKPGLPFLLAGPIVPLSVLAYFFVIPKFGMIGASFVYTSFAWLGAVVTITAVYYLWQTYPPGKTILWSVLISVAAYIAAQMWSTPGLLVIVKVCLITLIILVCYFITNAVKISEIRLLGSGLISRDVITKNTET